MPRGFPPRGLRPPSRRSLSRGRAAGEPPASAPAVRGTRPPGTRRRQAFASASFDPPRERARRLISGLRALGVQPGERVATFSWNHQQHVEAYLGVPAMGAVLHTLNIRLFDKDLAYIVEHAQDRVVIVDRSLLPAWEKVAARVR